jgi:endoglucanase Acf2
MGERELKSIAEDIKTSLNNFLWMNLPDEITLKEAENIACEIHSTIMNEYYKRQPKNPVDNPPELEF